MAAGNNEKTTKKKVPGRPFEKGKSGNPNGRPKIPEEFKELARTQSIPALKVAIAIMNNEDAKHSDRIKAAELVIDRAYGKAVQDLTLGNNPEAGAFEVNIKVVE